MSGFRVQGLRFRVQGLGFRVQGLGFRGRPVDSGLGLISEVRKQDITEAPGSQIQGSRVVVKRKLAAGYGSKVVKLCL